jgi:transposase
MSQIDSVRMAQFFSLSGAAELVEAFSAIPPGEVRDSVIQHAQALARAAGWSPPVPFGMEAAQRPISRAEPRRLTSPFAESLVSTSLEGQIIERALRGEADHIIAADLGIGLGVVVRLKRKARTEGRVVFPGDEAKPKAKGSPPKSRKLEGVPIPPPPWWWEDPASPVWENPSLLPGLSASAAGSMAAMGPHDSRGFKTMAQAAARRGMTLQAYIAQRYEILRRVEGLGELPTKVAIDLKVSPYVVYALLESIGRPRMGAVIKGAAPAKDRRSPDYLPAVLAKARGAAHWGFANIAAYDQMREEIRDLRMGGVMVREISERLDMPTEFVKTTVQHWRRHGARFPAGGYGSKAA